MSNEPWTVFGNTLRFGPGPDDYAAFPGDAGTAQRLAEAHNALRERLRQAEASAAALRRALDAATLVRPEIADDFQSGPLIRAALADDAGAAVLAELRVARGVVGAAWGHTRGLHRGDRLYDALVAYDETTKEGGTK